MKAALLLLLLFLFGRAAEAAIVTYTSEGPHFIQDETAAFFPLAIEVTGLADPIAEISVTFGNLFHERPADLDIVLVGPSGQNVMLISDVGELLSENDSRIDQVTLTFRDGFALLSPSTRITAGTYAPTNYQGVVEEIGEMDQVTPNPAPVGPYGTALSAFNGTNPNGTWKLFLQDDRDDESGMMDRWSLTVTTVPEPSSALLLLAGAAALRVRRRESRKYGAC